MQRDFCLNENCTLLWTDHQLYNSFLVWYNGLLLPIIMMCYTLIFAAQFIRGRRAGSMNFATYSCAFASIGNFLYGTYLALGNTLNNNYNVSSSRQQLVMVIYMISFATLSVPAILVHEMTVMAAAGTLASSRKKSASGHKSKIAVNRKVAEVCCVIYGSMITVIAVYLSGVLGNSVLNGVRVMLSWTTFVALFILFSIVRYSSPLQKEVLETLAQNHTRKISEAEGLKSSGAANSLVRNKKLEQVGKRLRVWNIIMFATCIVVGILYGMIGITQLLRIPIFFMVVNNVIVCNALTFFGVALMWILVQGTKRQKQKTSIEPATRLATSTKSHA